MFDPEPVQDKRLGESFAVVEPFGIIPLEENKEGFALALLNDEKFGRDSITLDEGPLGYTFVLFFVVKGDDCHQCKSTLDRFDEV